MKNIYEKIIERAKDKKFSVLATIIVQTGSTPRGIGTAFLIMEDGTFMGTIGGGQLEARVLEEAEKVFESRAPLRLSFVLKGTDVEKTEMLCGGDAEVFLEPISPDNPDHLDIYQRAKAVIERGSTGMMATVVDPDKWEAGDIPKLFFEVNVGSTGSLTGQPEMEKKLAGETDRILKKRQPDHVTFQDANGEQIEFLLEPVMTEPVIYVFGGGHVSLQIAPLAARVRFKVVVIDDRPEFADPLNFPEAAKVHECPFEGVFDRLPIDQSSYIVIVTRGHKHDRIVLTQSLKSQAGYIGMIGSRRKRAIVYKKLLEEGFTQADLDRVYSPIGIDIQAETPEEIAVSIVAELIKVRAEVL
jgi:xanthine dehydrogenase accessory factor